MPGEATMLNVRIDIRERPDGTVLGVIRSFGKADSDELAAIGVLDGSSWTCSGASVGGSFLDVLDVMQNRLAVKLEQGIIF
jgi:hypothetical protein